MTAPFYVRRACLLMMLCGLLVSCGLPMGGKANTSVPVATLMPTPTGAAPVAELPVEATPIPSDSGWIAVAPGAELRRLRIELGQSIFAQVRVIRLDPTLLRFQVGYAPDNPRSPTQWAKDSGALALINGGFFDEQNHTVSLLVMNGQAVGESYSGQGGMFMVYPSGAVDLRGLAENPYDPSEQLAEAIQGWPLLVQPGGTAAYHFEDGVRARRSALAIDRAGRVLLIACPGTHFTLAELATWLAGSDLEINAAVNLDGGSSTGMFLSAAETNERVDAFVPLPIVLLALPK